ncbi:MAG: tripartite tricarboxylate transporter substrate binding protein, partial [Comamonadaceae bacterium]
VGQKVSEQLGQPVVIENRGGAGGNIGMDAVAKAAPDGYTIGFGAISTNALNPHIYKSMSFDPRKDFTAISLLGTSTIVLEVPATSAVKSVPDLVAAAKKEPGLPYATAGAGTSMNLAGVMFAQMTGTELTHVAYKGSGPAIVDMLGGTIGVMFDNLPASLPHIQSGKLRALAVAGPVRSPSLPNVPTMAEAGLKGYALDPWFGVYGPANLPAPIVKALNQAFVEALAMPEVKDKLVQAGFSPRGSSADELAKLTQSEYQRLGDVAKKAGMTAD